MDWRGQSWKVGGLFCLCVAGWQSVTYTINSTMLLLLLAILVVVPLALLVLGRVSKPPLPLWGLYVGCGGLTAVSLFLPRGTLAALLASSWLLFTACIAFWGVWWLWHNWQQGQLPEICLHVGLAYLVVGGVWLLFARWGRPFLGFQEPIVTLTALHFHYISLGALGLTGLLGIWLRDAGGGKGYGVYRPLAIGLILLPMVVAVGITFSRLIEGIAGILLALTLFALSFLALRLVPAQKQLIAKLGFLLSSLSLWLTMFLAGSYALSRLLDITIFTIPQMIRWHGWLNAVGFTLCGFVAWQATSLD